MSPVSMGREHGARVEEVHERRGKWMRGDPADGMGTQGWRAAVNR